MQRLSFNLICFSRAAFGPSFAKADAICRKAEATGTIAYAGLDTSLNPALGDSGSICLGLQDLEEVGARGVSLGPVLIARNVHHVEGSGVRFQLVCHLSHLLSLYSWAGLEAWRPLQNARWPSKIERSFHALFLLPPPLLPLPPLPRLPPPLPQATLTMTHCTSASAATSVACSRCAKTRGSQLQSCDQRISYPLAQPVASVLTRCR